MIKKSLFALFFILFLTLLFLLIRLPFLTADPPAGFSLDFFGDEGCWVHNVRNRVLFDAWILDDINMAYLISPTYCFSTYLFLKTFGSGLYQARLVSAASGALAPLLLFLILSRLWDRRAAFWGAVLLGCNFFFLCFNRIALVDSLLLMATLLFFWLWIAGRDRPAFRFLAGVAFAAACLVKVSALFVAPALFFLLLRERSNQNFRTRHAVSCLIAFLAGCAVVFAGYMVLVAYPNFHYIQILKGKFTRHNFPLNPVHMIANFSIYIVRQHGEGVALKNFFLWAPFIILTAWLYMIHFFYRLLLEGKSIWRKISRVEILALSWLFSYLLILGPMAYKPDRRYIMLLPPLIILALRFLLEVRCLPLGDIVRELFSFQKGRVVRRFLLLAALLFFPLVYAAPLVTNLLYPFLVRADRAFSLGKISGMVGFVSISFCLVISFLLLVLLLFLFRGIFQRIRTVRFPLWLAIGSILCFNLGLYALSLNRATFTIFKASGKLNTIFDEKTVVMGEPSDTLCLETRAFSFFTAGTAPGIILNDHAVERFAPDYYLMMKYENNPLRNTPVGIDPQILEFMEDIPLLPGKSGEPRMHARLYRVIKESKEK